jgi:DNA-directed RNA polymerase specialized sigma24 family protein
MTEDFGDIVAGVRAGLPDAWSALYRRFYPTLVGYICKHFRAEVPDAEDLASDVLLLVAQQMDAGPLSG